MALSWSRLSEEIHYRAPLADALQLVLEPLYVNKTLSRVLLNMDMLAQAARLFQQHT